MDPRGRGTDVVLDGARHAEARLEPVAERQVVPAEVDRERHDAGQRVDPARDADADRRRRRPASRRPRARAASTAAAMSLGGLVRLADGGRACGGRGPVGAVDDEDRDLAAADVDADEQLRRLSRRRRAGGRRRPSRRASRRVRVGHRARHRPSSRVISSADAPRTTTFAVGRPTLDLGVVGEQPERRGARPRRRPRRATRRRAR